METMFNYVMEESVDLPYLPDIPDRLPVARALVERLRLLRLDDEYGTLDLYVGAVDNFVVEAVASLEDRIASLETGG